jgi:hypothetical protein
MRRREGKICQGQESLCLWVTGLHCEDPACKAGVSVPVRIFTPLCARWLGTISPAGLFLSQQSAGELFRKIASAMVYGRAS